MKTKNIFLKSIFILTICSILLTLYFYPNLPNEIPIHFDYLGNPDNYGPRSFTFFTAFLPLIVLVLLKIIPKFDPKSASYKLHQKAYNIFIAFLVLLFILLHWFSLYVALGYNLPIQKVVPISIGMLFIVIGNYMPQIRPNYTYGIKLPWTLADENNWRATHRIGGYCYIASGILFLLAGFASSLLISTCLLVAFIFLFIPMLYSYLYFKRHISK